MLTIEKRGDDTIVIAGRLDAAHAPEAQPVLDAASGMLTIDCSHLEYISSAGLGLLMKTQKRLSKEGGKLRLVGVSRHLRDILQFAGMETFFEIELARE